MNCYTREQIEAAMASKGYKYFTGGDYDVNIIGVRNSETKNRVTNAFDDCLTISYKIDGEWQFHCFKCTTDPGTAYMNDPIVESKGTAILKPGQYRGSHKLRLHQGKYLALGQKRDVTVYRDNNRDNNYDLDESKIKIFKWKDSTSSNKARDICLSKYFFEVIIPGVSTKINWLEP